MPNRILKESITTSEDVDALSSDAERLFTRLMVKADDFGRYHGNLKLIKSGCFPLKSDAINCKQLQAWVCELCCAGYTGEEEGGLVQVFIADDGKEYLAFRKWDKHQTCRAAKSKFPSPQAIECSCKQLQADVSKCSRIRIRNLYSLIDNRYSINASSGDEGTRKPTYVDFELFWNLYPRKVAKADAKKQWDKLKPDDALFETIKSNIQQHIKNGSWTKENIQFIPHPTTWLNQKRWEDEVPEFTPTSPTRPEPNREKSFSEIIAERAGK